MDYQQIIEKLKEQGKITEEDINAIVDAGEENIRAFSSLLHVLLCKDKHITLEEHAIAMQGCPFYAENQMDNTWKLPTHKKWLSVTKNIAEHTSLISQEKELIVKICNAIAVREEWTGLFDSVYMELSKAGLTKKEY
jgi:hypothetical protein